LWIDNAARGASYYGPQSTAVATALSQQAHIREQRGDLTAAEALRREALALFRTDLGEDHWYSVASRLDLAAVLARQNCFAEAETLLLEAQQIASRDSGIDGGVRRRRVAQCGVLVYQAWMAAEPGEMRREQLDFWQASVNDAAVETAETPPADSP
jgi:hypothetical protein